MRIDSKKEEFALVEDEVAAIDDLIDEAQSLLTWVSPSKHMLSHLRTLYSSISWPNALFLKSNIKCCL